MNFCSGGWRVQHATAARRRVKSCVLVHQATQGIIVPSNPKGRFEKVTELDK